MLAEVVRAAEAERMTDMMEPWVWAVLLLAAGLSLAVVEIFIPSGGLIGFFSFCTIVASIIVAFRQGSMLGLGMLAAALAGLPIVIVVALQWWPKTPLGRRMLLKVQDEEDLLPDSPRLRYLKSLIGRVGKATTKMLPSGAVLIDGRNIDAVSEGMAIEAGQRVRVIEVRANRVVVRTVNDEAPSEDAKDPLARPIDTIIPDVRDPFGDQPA